MALIDNLEKMLADGRDDAMLRFGLGSGYMNLKEFSLAIPHLRRCLEHDPNYAAAYKLLAKALVRTDDKTAAREVIVRGLPVARLRGDKQTERELEVLARKTGAPLDA